MALSSLPTQLASEGFLAAGKTLSLHLPFLVHGGFGHGVGMGDLTLKWKNPHFSMHMLLVA